MFDERELSNFDGAPIYLYEFRRDSGDTTLHWRYCSADEDQAYSGDTYKSIPISDSGITQDSEPATTEFTITMPVTEEVPQLYNGMSFVPSDEMFLTVRRMHLGDTEARVTWVGALTRVTQLDDIKCEVVCATLAASFQRGGLRLSWMRGCPHATFDSECSLDPEDFRTDGTVATITGTTIQINALSSQVDGYFDGGYIQWELDSGVTERRGILTHVGNTITILGVATGLLVSDSVAAFPGDDHTIQTCNDKFNNLSNYGGHNHMPGKSPFDGDPVF